MTMTPQKNAVLRAEVEAWAAGQGDDSQPSPFVNVRAAGFTTMRDAEKWARDNAVPAVKINGRLLARRTDVEAAQAAPVRERVCYTTSVTGAVEYEVRGAAAEAVRLAMGWKTIALSHVVEMDFVTAYETEEQAVYVDPGDPSVRERMEAIAPRIIRHTCVAVHEEAPNEGAAR